MIWLRNCSYQCLEIQTLKTQIYVSLCLSYSEFSYQISVPIFSNLYLYLFIFRKTSLLIVFSHFLSFPLRLKPPFWPPFWSGSFRCCRWKLPHLKTSRRFTWSWSSAKRRLLSCKVEWSTPTRYSRYDVILHRVSRGNRPLFVEFAFYDYNFYHERPLVNFQPVLGWGKQWETPGLDKINKAIKHLNELCSRLIVCIAVRD